MGTLTVNINNTGLNLALPRVREELGLSLAELQWLAATYVLVLAALTMLGGAMGDRFDKRTVLTVGLSTYVAGSVLAMFVSDGLQLVASRALAAAGASVLVPVGLSILRLLARSRRQLAQYMSVWGSAVGFGMAIGPVAGGWATDLAGWRSFFAMMAVLGLVYLVFVWVFIPELPSSPKERVGWLSHLLLAGCMLTSTAFLIELQSDVPAVLRVLLGASAVVLAIAWIWRERTSSRPMIPATAFRNRPFVASMVIAFVNYLGLGTTLFVTALFLQDLVHLRAGQAGLVSIPLAVASALGARWAGRAIGSRHTSAAIRIAAMSIIVGVFVMVVGMVVISNEESVGIVIMGFIAGTFLMGFGFGAANTPVNYLAMSSLPDSVAGLSSSCASTSRQLGQSTGVAIGGLLLSLGVSAGGGASEPWAYLPPALGLVGVGLVMLFLPTLFRKGV